jgi:LL-diaminopimelate aminotransferase
VRAQIAGGRDLIDLSMGAPDLSPPGWVQSCLRQAAADPQAMTYPTNHGLDHVRRSVAAFYRRRFGVILDPDTEVLPVPGAKAALGIVCAALTDPDDVVLVPDPGYPAYGPAALLADARPLPVRLDSLAGYAPTLDRLGPSERRAARLLFLNYPSNPTGAVLTADQLNEAVGFCRQHRIYLCYDNPYSELIYTSGIDSGPGSILAIPEAREVAVEVLSLSKTFSVPGWRAAFLAGNSEIIAAVRALRTSLDIGVPNVVQIASGLTLDRYDGPSSPFLDEYRARRDILCAGLQAAGFEAPPPAGGLYVWLKVPLPWSGDDFTATALQRGVALTSGRVYGSSGADRVRVALTARPELLTNAVARLSGTGSHCRPSAATQEA